MESHEPGSVTKLLERTKAGDIRAGQALLIRLQQPDITKHLRRNLSLLQPADKDVAANDALWRLYNGLLSGKFTQPNNREDLFRLIGGINWKCSLEIWNSRNPRNGKGTGASSLPENYEIPADEKGPAEIVAMEDFIRDVMRKVQGYVDSNPEDAFMIDMAKMLFEGYLKSTIIKNLNITRHKYNSRYEILLCIAKERTHGID